MGSEDGQWRAEQLGTLLLMWQAQLIEKWDNNNFIFDN